MKDSFHHDPGRLMLEGLFICIQGAAHMNKPALQAKSQDPNLDGNLKKSLMNTESYFENKSTQIW